MDPQRWPIKQAAIVLGVEPTKATQSMRPAIRKVALLLLANAELTMGELVAEMHRIREEREQMRASRLAAGAIAERLEI